MRQAIVVAVWLGSGLLPAWADGAARLDPEVLALCSSRDPSARLYCLHELERTGDAQGEARQLVADMAEHDPAVREQARAAYAHVYGPGAGAAPAETTVEAAATTAHARAQASGDAMRVIYAPTAFLRPPGTSSFNAFELGTFTLDHGVTDNLTLGVQTAIPIGGFVVGPTLHAAVPIEGGAVGVYASALLVAPFSGGTSAVLFGGGPMVTLGNYDNYVNFGVLGYFVKADDFFGLVIPHVGASARVSRRVRIGAELYVPGAVGDHVSDSGFGKIAIVLWGLRVFNDSLWGDIALADPICADCGDIYSVIPLGIPFLNFGTTW